MTTLLQNNNNNNKQISNKTTKALEHVERLGCMAAWRSFKIETKTGVTAGGRGRCRAFDSASAVRGKGGLACTPRQIDAKKRK